MRPDSGSYCDAAESLVEKGTYSQGRDSVIPETKRTPGYPVFLALLKFCSRQKDSSIILYAIWGCLVSALSVFPIAESSRYLFHHRLAGICAGFFAIMNLTCIANAPLILADTLFGFLVALQVMFLLKAWRKNSFSSFLLGIIFSVSATYVKPINLPFLLCVFPCTVCITARISNKKKMIACLSIWGIAILLLCPWMIRNYLCHAGFVIDSNTGLTVLHNTAALLAHAERKNGDEKRAEIDALIQTEFLSHPEQYKTVSERNHFLSSLYRDAILQYPFSFLATHFFQFYILLPDIPSFLESYGISSSGRGTLGVLRQKGLLAAGKHYLSDTSTMPCHIWGLMLILLLLTFISYILSLWGLVLMMKKRKWYILIFFVAFSLYYLAVPGPILMSRYQIPAIPFLSVLASFPATLLLLHRKRIHVSGCNAKKRMSLFALLMFFFCFCSCDNSKPLQKQSSEKTRIISLSPGITETIFQLGQGDKIIACSTACDFPEEVKKLPHAGNFADPFLEKILDMHPDYVLSDQLIVPTHEKILNAAGIKTFIHTLNTPNDYYAFVEYLGDILECHEKAREEITRCRNILSEMETYPELPCSVLAVIYEQPLMVAGSHSLLDMEMKLMKVKNIAGKVDEPYFRCSEEWLSLCHTDFILCLHQTIDVSSLNHLKELIPNSDVEFIIPENESSLLRPGPRAFEAILNLRKNMEEKVKSREKTK